MATKTVQVEGIGELVLQKNRRSRSLKITLLPTGKIRVSLPLWVPYQTAIEFAKSKTQWIQDNRHSVTRLQDGMAIGKAHHLYFMSGEKLRTRLNNGRVEVYYPAALSSDHSDVQATARRAAQRALRREAEGLLPQKLATLAAQHRFTYKSVQVRHLKSRWGSCNQSQEITLNFFLMQLPWELIDYVLLHELTHTKHLHHGPEFWNEFERVLPQAKTLRRTMRQHKPTI